MFLQKRIQFRAGHFVFQGMNSTKQGQLQKLIGGGIDWTAAGLQHGNIGWNSNSRRFLNNCFAGINNNPNNRSGLPPHRYYSTQAIDVDLTKLQLIVEEFELIRTPQFFLRQLSELAQQAWAANEKVKALKLQLQHGSVSLELYYFNGEEMK